MIDTVILELPHGGYVITDYSKFNTTADKMREETAPYASYKNNPTADDKARGIYLPQLTIYKRGRQFFLKIQFSAPKLLFDNNLFEVLETDFEAVLDALQRKLVHMGVKVFRNVLANAPVSSIHPSKNILLTGGYTSTFAIKELGKCDIDLRFDLDKKVYRNNGQSLQVYSNTHSIVFYDKISDLGKPAKRAIDQDQTSGQATIFDSLRPKEKRCEVLKYEVRISKRTKLNEVLQKLGVRRNLTFRDVFNKDLCRKILHDYWELFFANNMTVLTLNSNPQKVLTITLKQYPHVRVLKLISFIGIHALCRDDEGIRGFRQSLGAYRPKASWAVVKKRLQELNDVIAQEPVHGFVGDIERAIRTMEPVQNALHRQNILST